MVIPMNDILNLIILMKIFITLIGTGLLLIFLNSCQETKPHDLKLVVGTYQFVYPSGEIEIVMLLPDTTYT